jgi:Histone chaperone domain CHZ
MFTRLFPRSTCSNNILQEDSLEEIDPTQIVGRRTRGRKVDYSSAEAHAKAGIKPGTEEEEEEEEDAEMKD